MATPELTSHPHPDDAALAEYAQGDLFGESLSSLEAHVARCSSCREVVAGLLRVFEPDDHGPRKGLVVGRYVVLDPVGAGAIGEVFSAHDSVLERTVALKWLYPSVFEPNRESLRTRLINEARALARVQHPNVVAVHDVLAHDDADVIVMELVRHAKRLRDAVDGRRDPRRLLQAFVDAGRGLAAAHEAGVIHRDFKPDNVLVDGTGRVVVVDFGLARHSGLEDSLPATDATGRKTSVSGTPAYLAPERWLRAPASIATDQYSFCVSLYECLTGRLPFASHEPSRRLDELRAGPPPLGVPVDARVERALRRGLSFDAEARWPSMVALTDELAAALAPPPSRRWMALGGVAVASVLALLVGTRHAKSRCESADAPVKSVWTSARAASLRQTVASVAHPAAASTAERLVTSLGRYADDLGATRRKACEATAFEGESDALLALRQSCTARRLADLEALLKGLEQVDGKVVERAVSATESLGAPAACLDPKLALVTPQPQGAAGEAVEKLAARVSEVRAARLLGRTKDSVQLAEAVVKDARAIGWAPLLSDALFESASGLERLSKFDAARDALAESVKLALGAGDSRFAFTAATLLLYVDGVDRQKAEAAAAWSTVATALEPREATPSLDVLRLRNVEATLAMRQGRPEEAVETLRAVVAALEASGQLETVNGSRVLVNLSGALRESKRAAEAVEVSRRSIALMEKVLSPNHPDVAGALNNLGSALAEEGRFDEAEPIFRRGIELRERLFGPDSLALATPHFNLAELAYRRGKGEVALEAFRRARAIIEKGAGPDDEGVVDAQLGEALALGLLGRHQESLELLQVVLPALEKRTPPSLDVPEAKVGQARALRALHRDEPTVRALLESVLVADPKQHAKQIDEARALLAAPPR